MSLVSSRLSLIHLATVQRDQNAGAVDDAGFAEDPDWEDHLTDLPCRLWATAGREAVTDSTTLVVVEDLRLVVTVDTDVTEADRLGDVTYRGTTILARPTQIRAVLRRADHLELVLARIA